MDHFDKFENQLISSYESTLAPEGREICKKIDSLIKDDEKFDIDKTQYYCIFCLNFKKDSLDKDLFNMILVISPILNIVWIAYLKQEKIKKKF